MPIYLLFVFALFLAEFQTAYAKGASQIPSCSISVSPAVINKSQSATLKWNSTQGALFAELDNGIGPVAPDGELVVSPEKSTVYTLHTWNALGKGGYCSVALTISSDNGDNVPKAPVKEVQPTVQLYTLAIHPASSKVSLGDVPYTGPVESTVYILFLLTLIITAVYAIGTYGKEILLYGTRKI